MTVFNKSSLLFIFLNILRVLSVVAIVMAFAGELLVLVKDVQGYRAANTVTPSGGGYAGTTTHARLTRRAIPFGSSPAHRHRQIVRDYVGAHGSSVKATANATAAGSGSSALTSEETGETDTADGTTSCSYEGNVPKGAGGIVFVAIQRIFCCIILLFSLASEMPPASRWTQRFWAYAFPPFGEKFGVGVLGIVQVFLGSIILSHYVTGFPNVAAWFLFILGFINMIAGLAYGARIKALRSLTPYQPDDDIPQSRPGGGGLRGLRLNSASSSQYENMPESSSNGGGSSVGMGEKRRGKPIHISPPVVVPMPPPTYHAPPRNRGEEATQ